MTEFIRKEFISEKSAIGDRIAVVYHNGRPPQIDIIIIGDNGRTQSFLFEFPFEHKIQSEFDKFRTFLNTCFNIDKYGESAPKDLEPSDKMR